MYSRYMTLIFIILVGARKLISKDQLGRLDSLKFEDTDGDCYFIRKDGPLGTEVFSFLSEAETANSIVEVLNMAIKLGLKEDFTKKLSSVFNELEIKVDEEDPSKIHIGFLIYDHTGKIACKHDSGKVSVGEAVEILSRGYKDFWTPSSLADGKDQFYTDSNKFAGSGYFLLYLYLCTHFEELEPLYNDIFLELRENYGHLGNNNLFNEFFVSEIWKEERLSNSFSLLKHGKERFKYFLSELRFPISHLMDRKGLSRGFESIFKRKLESLTMAEEKFTKIRMLQNGRSKRTTAHTVFCVLVNKSRKHKKMYIRVEVNGVPIGIEDKVRVFPGSFLISDYDGSLDPDGMSLVEVKILDEQNDVLLEKSLEIPNQKTLRTSLALRVTYEGNTEDVELDFCCIKTDLSASGVYDDQGVIGHRGCGMDNLATTDMKENTISSFIEAYSRGAKWVELDVHLTKDKVPVIFHDFGMWISDDEYRGIDKMTCNEFLAFVGNPNEDNHSLPCTLEKIFDFIDADLGVNVEIKFPSPQYVREHEFLCSAEELVQEVVEVLQRKRRQKIVFSSFHPHILFLLKLRVPNFSTYMLTEAMEDIYGSPYIGSLYEALYFCSKLGLDGIALDWNSISENPSDIIQIFKEFGLETMVYGDGVNISSNAETLRSAGVKSIIADDLRLICG